MSTSIILILFQKKKVKILYLIYCLSFAYLCIDLIHKLNTSKLIGFLFFGFNPQGLIANVTNNLFFIGIFFFPIFIFLIKKEITKRNFKIFCSISFGFLFLSNYYRENNIYSVKNDLSVTKEEVLSLTTFRYDSSMSSLENAVTCLDWVNKNIEYSAQSIIKTIPELIKEGNGTCGVQSRVFEKIMRLHGYNSRYVSLFSFDRTKSHTVVELFIENKWVHFDPQFNKVYYEKNTPLSTIQIKKDKNLINKHPFGGTVFDEILILENNEFFLVSNRNKYWFY